MSIVERDACAMAPQAQLCGQQDHLSAPPSVQGYSEYQVLENVERKPQFWPHQRITKIP